MVAELLYTAQMVWYEGGMICVQLNNLRELRFSVEHNSKLKQATDSQRNNIEVICNGTGLHWPDLDEDLSLTGIIEGRYGY